MRSPAYYHLNSEREWEVAGAEEVEDVVEISAEEDLEVVPGLMADQMSDPVRKKSDSRRPSSPIGKFAKSTAVRTKARLNRLLKAQPETEAMGTTSEQMAAMAFELAQKMMEDMRTQEAARGKSSGKGKTPTPTGGSATKTSAKSNAKAALTGSEAPFPTLSNKFSDDITFNMVRSMAAQTITFKWELLLLQMRVKNAVESDSRGLRWKKNPRWLMILHGRHLASLWGHVGAARQLCWNPKTFYLAEGDKPVAGPSRGRH